MAWRSRCIPWNNSPLTVWPAGISTGIFGYPMREAYDTAIATIAEELAVSAKVILCTYDEIATNALADA